MSSEGSGGVIRQNPDGSIGTRPPQPQPAGAADDQQQQAVERQHGMRGGQGRSPLSSEEKRILSQCSRESFWYRSLPFALLTGGVAYVAVAQGRLKPHAVYGPAPKVIIGGIIGYFAGKLSYGSACAEKILQEAPNSDLADMIRARRGVPTRRDQSFDSPAADAQSPGAFEGAADALPQSPAASASQYGDSAPPAPTPSYEERQRWNRQQFEQTRGQGAGPSKSVPQPVPEPAAPEPYPPPPPPSPVRAAAPPDEQSPSGQDKPRRVNKYGDEIFE